MLKMSLKWLFFCILFVKVHSWDQEQLDVFDVVEEIDQNFYQLMNISQDADSSQIKRAFRSQSLVLHPDKNSAPDAEVQFRNLVAVYDVLKDPNKRKHYDDVLVNGLPNWRSAIYYYRHYRKMGLMEMSVILFVLITIGQYLIGWASYFEKKYTHETVYQAKIEKRKKKLTKKGQVQDLEDLDEIFNVPKPSFKNTLPFQIPRLVYCSIIRLPSVLSHIKQLKEEAELQKKLIAEQERLQKELELKIEQKKIRDKACRKRKGGFKLEERDDEEFPPPPVGASSLEDAPKITRALPVSGGLWTDDDLSELTVLVKKFPGGTTDRWEKIAEQMNRSIHEVTFMAAKLKENFYRLPNENNTNILEPDIPKKQKTRGGKTGESGTDLEKLEWSQVQQKALESALAKYPKGPADRWDKIAKCVPNKTKEECMLRYKYLVELVKKKKEEDLKPTEKPQIEETPTESEKTLETK